MSEDKIRVLVVEDSAFMRTAISKMLVHNNIEIVDYAINGKIALEKIEKLKPDVITLDIEMPIMNGIQVLENIHENNKIPILVVSTLTKQGAEITIDALELGATDFVTKPDSINKISEMKEELLNKILLLGEKNSLKNRIIRRQNIKNQNKKHDGTDFQIDLISANNNSQKTLKSIETFPRNTSENKELQNSQSFSKSYKNKEEELSETVQTNRSRSKLTFIPKIIIIGISTGGPVALQSVIPSLKKDFPLPVVIVQHMPPNFTKSLANRLNSISQINVKEIEDNESLQSGTVYFAPGGRQISFKGLKVKIHDDTPEDELYKPSFNMTLKSAMDNWNEKIVALVMTGMGHDGAEMLKKLSDLGGYNLSQDPATCVVAGMTTSAIKLNSINRVIGLNDIANSLNNLLK